MPFTFSHPAFVLPFMRSRSRWFSLTGLVVGSITPDFEYFLRMEGQRVHGHTVAGIFWFDLPLALIICFLFHNLVRNPFINHLPASFQQRFYNVKGFRWNAYFRSRWSIVSSSILLGIVSHLFTDAFTNGSGYFVAEFSFLQRTVPFADTFIPYNAILHRILSLGGLAVLGWAIWKLPVDKQAPVNTHRSPYWTTAFLVTGFFFIVGVSERIDDEMRSVFWLYTPVLIIIFISSFLLALLITSAFFKVKRNAYQWEQEMRDRKHRSQHHRTKKSSRLTA